MWRVWQMPILRNPRRTRTRPVPTMPLQRHHHPLHVQSVLLDEEHDMNEECAARRLATAKARLILAEVSSNPTEFKDALIALQRAEDEYVQAVNQ